MISPAGNAFHPYIVIDWLTVLADKAGYSRCFLLGDPKLFPGQMGSMNPTASCQTTLGFPCQLDVPGRGVQEENQMTKQPQLAAFGTKGQQLYYEVPLDDLTPCLLL